MLIVTKIPALIAAYFSRRKQQAARARCFLFTSTPGSAPEDSSASALYCSVLMLRGNVQKKIIL